MLLTGSEAGKLSFKPFSNSSLAGLLRCLPASLSIGAGSNFSDIGSTSVALVNTAIETPFQSSAALSCLAGASKESVFLYDEYSAGRSHSTHPITSDKRIVKTGTFELLPPFLHCVRRRTEGFSDATFNNPDHPRSFPIRRRVRKVSCSKRRSRRTRARRTTGSPRYPSCRRSPGPTGRSGATRTAGCIRGGW